MDHYGSPARVVIARIVAAGAAAVALLAGCSAEPAAAPDPAPAQSVLAQHDGTYARFAQARLG